MNEVAQDTPGHSRSIGVILALGTAQTIAWASSYYLAAPIARDLGMTPTVIFGALSGALWVSALLSLSAFGALLLLRTGKA